MFFGRLILFYNVLCTLRAVKRTPLAKWQRSPGEWHHVVFVLLTKSRKIPPGMGLRSTTLKARASLRGTNRERYPNLCMLWGYHVWPPPDIICSNPLYSWPKLDKSSLIWQPRGTRASVYTQLLNVCALLCTAREWRFRKTVFETVFKMALETVFQDLWDCLWDCLWDRTSCNWIIRIQ